MSTMNENNFTNSETNSEQESNTQRKKAPKWLIPVCAVVVLLITAVTAVLCSPTLSNSFALLTMKPAAYYQKVETKNLFHKIDFFTKNYETSRTIMQEQFKKGMGLEQTITAKVDSTITDMFGLSDLKSIGVKTIGMYKDQNSQADFSVLVNNSEAFTFNLLMDMKSSLIYYLFPSLNEAYLTLSMDDVAQMQDYDDSIGSIDDVKKIQNLMLNPPFTGTLLNNSLKKYTEIIIQNVTNVTMEKNVELKTNEASGKYTELKIQLSPEEQYTIIEKILETAKGDSDFSNVLATEDIITAEEYKSKLEELLNQLKTNKENFLSESSNLLIKVWVTKKGIIAGHEFSIESSDDTSAFGYRFEQEKTDVVMESWVSSSNKDILNIKSRGTKKDTAYTGNLDILFTNPETGITNTTKIDVDNFTTDPMATEIDGSLKITNSALGIFSLVANFSGNVDKQDVSIDVMQGDTSLVSITSTSSRQDYKDITFPSDNVKSYNMITEMEDYMMSSDLEGFLSTLKEKVNIEAFPKILDSYFYY